MSRVLSFYTLAYSRESFRRIVVQTAERHFDEHTLENRREDFLRRAEQETGGDGFDDDQSDSGIILSFYDQLIDRFFNNGGHVDDFSKAQRAAAHLVRQTNCAADDRQCEICMGEENEDMSEKSKHSLLCLGMLMLVSVAEACGGELVGRIDFDDDGDVLVDRFLAIFRDYAAEMFCDDDETVVLGILSTAITTQWVENRREVIEMFESGIGKRDRCRRVDLERIRQFFAVLEASEDCLESGNLAGLLFQYG